MKIICIGLNYKDHAAELGIPLPKIPLIFMKPVTAFHKPEQDFYIPSFSNDVQFEAEIVLKVCKNGKSIEPKFAHKYYNEYTIGIDFTARDLQRQAMANGHPWERAKSFDHSAVVGEMMPIEQLHFDTFNFQLKKNGELYQNGKTSEMIFNFDDIIVEVSKFFTLQQGDLIFTGSPAGVSRVDIGDTLELLQENKSLYTINIK